MKIILSDSQNEQHPADSFDWVPAQFRKDHPKDWHQRRRHASVRRLIAGLPGEVLDYGCGYGDITYLVSKTNPVRGVDVDPPRIAFASAEYAPIPFSVAPASQLAFADASFDVVLSVVVIHFVPDPVAYLRESRRLLRAGGHLAIVCRQHSPFHGKLRALLGLKPMELARWVAPDGLSRQLWIPRQSEFIALAAREGFRVVKRDHFSDPLTDIHSWKELPVRTLEQMLSIAGVSSTANYFGLLLQKI